MKCEKCKNKIDKDSSYCTNCGNKINVIKIIIINIVNILLYVLSAILFLFTLLGWALDKSFLEGLLLFISAVFTCPLTYRITARYLKPIDKVYIRVIVIIFCFVIGMSISPSSQNTPEKNEDKSQVAIDETNKQNGQENKEQEELDKKKEDEELRIQQEAEKQKRAKEEQIKKQEEIRKQEEQRAKDEQLKREQLKKEGENNFIKIKKAYDNNEISANNVYKGNTYTLYGKVVGVSENGLFNKLLGNIGITIEINKDGEYFYAFCSFSNTERDKLSNINNGDYLLFKGVCYSWGNYDECKVL